MDWRGEAERKMLERILALLLSLAGLCDRAAGLPALLRLPVLAVLGHGEAAARPFVMELACAAGVPAHEATAACLAAGEAGRLAARFRALALVLGAVLVWARHPARFVARAAGPLAALTPPRRLREPHGLAHRAIEAPDTS